MNNVTTKSTEIQQDSMMRELTFEEISVVSGGNLIEDIFKNPSKAIDRGIESIGDSFERVGDKVQHNLEGAAAAAATAGILLFL